MTVITQSNIVPYLRRLRFTIGPVEEWKGATQGAGDVIQLLADGTTNRLRLSCAVRKTVMGIPTPSLLTIYNLSAATRNSIRNSLTKCTVEAGWDNVAMHQLFQGSVVSCVSERVGADIVTKLQVLQGYGAVVKSVVSVTYAENTLVRDCVKDLCSRLPGVTVTESYLKDIRGQIGRGGWSFAGSTKDALTQLAQEYGFSWTIDDGAVKVLGDKSQFAGVVQLDGKDGGLINVSPILQGPLQMRVGVKITALYVPGVTSGSTVRVRSSIAKNLDGDYRVHTFGADLDTHADSWTMNIESFRYL